MQNKKMASLLPKSCAFKIGYAFFFLCLAIQTSHSADLFQNKSQQLIEKQASHNFHTDNWAGSYIGGHLGGIIGADNSVGDIIDNSFPGDGGSGIIDGRSDTGKLVGGIYLGYNWKYNNDIILGIEGDIGAYGSVDTLLGSLRGRAGFTTDQNLFYGTAGLSYFSAQGGDSALFAGGFGGDGGNGGNGNIAGDGGFGGDSGSDLNLTRNSKDALGMVVGLGAEHKIGSQATIGIEGLYYNFNDDLADAGFDNEFFTIRGRLSFYLNQNRDNISLKDSSYSTAISNWSGTYFGGQVGGLFDASNNTIDSVRIVNGDNGADGFDGISPDDGGDGGGGGGGATAIGFLEEDSSFAGGIHIGHNWQNDSWVYGIQADGTFGANDRAYLASIRSRFGLTYGNHLFYGTAGVAFTRMNSTNVLFAEDGQNGQDGDDSVNEGGTGFGGLGGAGGIALTSSNQDDLVGYVVGAGVETRITDSISLGFEGLYYGFNGDDGVFRNNGLNGSFSTSKDDSNAFVIQSKLSFKF